jgi:hypothetical protein
MALVLAESARDLRDLRVFLGYGEHGSDTFTSRHAMALQLPRAGDVQSAWEAELALLRKLSDEHGLVGSLVARRTWLEQSPRACDHLFLPGNAGELALARDFVFLSTTSGPEQVNQGDVFAIVSSLLAVARNDGRGLEEGPATASNAELNWGQSVYGQTVLCPRNFQRYNDAVLRAALLRAATPAELDYSVDDECSAEVLALVQAEIDAWTVGKGHALPEFLMSLASGRLRLIAAHAAALATTCRDAGLTDELRALAAEAFGGTRSAALAGGQQTAGA